MTVDDLRPGRHLLLECRSGSHAYGLATPESDEDFRGVFLLPYDRLLGLEYTPQLADATNDRSYYELGRFVELLAKANPTALELLATAGEDVLYRHPVMDQLRVSDWLTKSCRDTFAGYAITQIRKARGLNKKVHNPMQEERAGVADFCYVIEQGHSQSLANWTRQNGIPATALALAKVDHARDLYAVYHDRTGAGWAQGVSRPQSNQVVLSDVPKGQPVIAYLSFNKDGYSTYCRDHRAYWDWVERRNDARYLGTLAHGQGYDAKNMMHTLRLLEMATEIFTEGRLNVRRPNQKFLLAVKAGRYTLDEVLGLAEERLAALDAAVAESGLPEELPVGYAEGKLVELRRVLYRI